MEKCLIVVLESMIIVFRWYGENVENEPVCECYFVDWLVSLLSRFILDLSSVAKLSVKWYIQSKYL
jgi:hypothetical protein